MARDVRSWWVASAEIYVEAELYDRHHRTENERKLLGKIRECQQTKMSIEETVQKVNILLDELWPGTDLHITPSITQEVFDLFQWQFGE